MITVLNRFGYKNDIKGGSVSVIAESCVLGPPAFASQRGQQLSQATNRCFSPRQNFQRR